MQDWRKRSGGLLLALSLLNCDNSGSHDAPAANAAASPSDAAPGAGAKEEGEKPADASEQTADASQAKVVQECQDYSKKLCEKAGAESGTCGAINELAPLLPAEACTAASQGFAFTEAALAEARKVCDDLANKLCAEIGEETQSCDLVRSKTVTFSPDRCNQMMGQYDKVLADLKQMEERNKPLEPEKAKEIATIGDAPAFGPEDATVVLVEFSDFQCPYCSRAAEVVEKVRENYGDRVRFVFRQFPLSFHKDAHLASQAALFAHKSGKFWEFHDKLFENQKALSRADLEKYAGELGLNVEELKQALDDRAFVEQVDAELEMGKGVAVSGTPTIFLNGKRLANATDYDTVSKQIEDALKQG